MDDKKSLNSFGEFLETLERLESIEPGRARKAIGIVTSTMDQTRRVEVERLVPDPKFDGFVKQRRIRHAHDEGNISHVGDIVEIMETRHSPKLKGWRIVRIVRRSIGPASSDSPASPAGQGTSIA